MATLVITNLTSEQVSLSDAYAVLQPSGSTGESITITRAASDIPRMARLAALVADGSVSVDVTYSDDEKASGFVAPPNSIQASDLAEVLATDAASGLILIRKAFTAAATGSADDVTIFAVNALPFKFRVVDAWCFVATAISSSHAYLRTRAAGSGTLLATFDSGSTGRVNMSDTATAVATPGSLNGLFLRRSDRAIAGEVFALVRRES